MPLLHETTTFEELASPIGGRWPPKCRSGGETEGQSASPKPPVCLSYGNRAESCGNRAEITGNRAEITGNRAEITGNRAETVREPDPPGGPDYVTYKTYD